MFSAAHSIRLRAVARIGIFDRILRCPFAHVCRVGCGVDIARTMLLQHFQSTSLPVLAYMSGYNRTVFMQGFLVECRLFVRQPHVPEHRHQTTEYPSNERPGGEN